MAKITLAIATGNWYDDGSAEYGRTIDIDYTTAADLEEKIDDLSGEDYANAYVDDIPLNIWLGGHWEVVQLADKIRESDEWDSEDLRELCDKAGMLDEWEAADGETFEAVVFKAAEKLGVGIQ